jgi:lysophospholipid acyltransferase (LPLAT)-like uncharacterized protein
MLQIITQLGSYSLTVTEQNEKLYRFAPLSGFTFRERFSIKVADLAFYVCIRILGMTTHFKVRGMENLQAVEAAGKLPIYCFWHDRIFLGTYFWRDRGIVVMTSQSFDGEYIARFIQRFGYGAIRGSSSQGGARALVEMVKSMRRGHPMAFTVDGPRGPRYEAKPGPIILAKKSGNPLLPFVIESRRYWTANSWDKMQIPKPFGKALVIINEPIYVGPDAGDAEVEAKLSEFQCSLDDLNRQGKEWRERTA